MESLWPVEYVEFPMLGYLSRERENAQMRAQLVETRRASNLLHREDDCMNPEGESMYLVGD